MIFWILTSCWYFGSIHVLERAYIKQDIMLLQKHMQHSHQRYMREQSTLFLSQIPSEKVDEKTKTEIITLLMNCLKNEDEFQDVRAACAVVLGNWNITESVSSIVQASSQMKQEEDRYWMYYALAKLNTMEAKSYLREQGTTDILLQQNLEEWLEDPNSKLNLVPIFQEFLEDER